MVRKPDNDEPHRRSLIDRYTVIGINKMGFILILCVAIAFSFALLLTSVLSKSNPMRIYVGVAILLAAIGWAIVRAIP